MPSEREERGTEGMAYMRLHIDRGSRGDRQGVQLVKAGALGGGVDGVSVVLGAAGDMPFVGGRTRPRADEV
jgi:hypothetical protein